MLVIIDAYNLIKQALKKEYVSESEIKYFIKLFKKYSEKKHNQLKVVFDGGPLAYVSRERHGLVEILHSGYSQSADDVIKDILQEYVGRANIVMISSDIELQKYADKLGISFLSAKEFYDKIFDVNFSKSKSDEVKRDNQLYKTSESNELDELMDIYTKNIQIKREDFEKQEPGKIGSNKDKKTNRILKKL